MSDSAPAATSAGIRVVIATCVGLMACAMIGLVIGAVFFTKPYF